MTIDRALTDRVTAILGEISSVEAARVPIEEELRTEASRLDHLAAKAAGASPGQWWLSPNPNFSAGAFNDAITAALLTIAPKPTREAMIERVKRACEAWRGLRMPDAERERRLNKLQADLRSVRARIELQRRAAEQVSGIMQARVNEDPSIWLLQDAELQRVAGNGRSPR